MQKNNIWDNGFSNLSIYIKTLIRSYLILSILLLISAIIITYTNLSEGNISIITPIIMILSIIYGGIYLSINIKRRGWLHGAIFGFIYFIILIILSKLLALDYDINSKIYYRTLLSVIIGIIGGMIGINIK